METPTQMVDFWPADSRWGCVHETEALLEAWAALTTAHRVEPSADAERCAADSAFSIESWPDLFDSAMAAEDGYLLENDLVQERLLNLLSADRQWPHLSQGAKRAVVESLMSCKHLRRECMFTSPGGRKVVRALCRLAGSCYDRCCSAADEGSADDEDMHLLRDACEELCDRAGTVRRRKGLRLSPVWRSR